MIKSNLEDDVHMLVVKVESARLTLYVESEQAQK